MHSCVSFFKPYPTPLSILKAFFISKLWRYFFIANFMSNLKHFDHMSRWLLVIIRPLLAGTPAVVRAAVSDGVARFFSIVPKMDAVHFLNTGVALIWTCAQLGPSTVICRSVYLLYKFDLRSDHFFSNMFPFPSKLFSRQVVRRKL